MKQLLARVPTRSALKEGFLRQPPLVRVLLVALVLCLLGALVAWPTLLQAWLVAWVTLAALPLGAIALLMVHGLTGGAWGDESRHLWHSVASSMPLFALALLPLLLGLDVLFPWTAPDAELAEVVRNKQAYLNKPFFIARTLFYLVVWVGLAGWLTRPSLPRRTSRWHAPGLIAWALTLTFFCYDWLMSLEPTFYSDIYGIEVMAICVVAVLALGLYTGAARLRPSIRLDLANLWLSVLLGWAFVAFSQLIIIWSANMPHEIAWYLHRGEGAWLWTGRLSVLLFLVIPFAMLLPTAPKRRAGWLRIAAAICLAGHGVHVHWLIWPAFAASAWAFVLGPIALVTLAAACLWWMGHARRQALTAPPTTTRPAAEVRHEGT